MTEQSTRQGRWHMPGRTGTGHDVRAEPPPGYTAGPEATAARPGEPGRGDGVAYREAWEARSRVVLTPVAAPSILGLFSFAGATFMVASNQAGWWGNTLVSPIFLAPFVLFLGGGAQLLAGMWAYRARDGLATAMHGAWGAFWLAWGLMMLFIGAGLFPPVAATTQPFGFWWIVIALVTAFGALGALGRNMALCLTLSLLAAGSAVTAAGIIGTTHSVVQAAGWVLVASACAGFYTAGAMLLEDAFGGHVVLPLGRWPLRGNVPGFQAMSPIGYMVGEPGVKHGQ